MNILLELRETAKSCPDVLQRKLLKDVADLLQDAIRVLFHSPTTGAMQNVNGLWSRADRLLGFARDTRPVGSGGAMKEGARLAA